MSLVVAIVAGGPAHVFSTPSKNVRDVGSVGTGGWGAGVPSLVLMTLRFLLLPSLLVGGPASILGPRGMSVRGVWRLILGLSRFGQLVSRVPSGGGLVGLRRSVVSGPITLSATLIHLSQDGDGLAGLCLCISCFLD